jgi:hypothetical protein
MQIEIVGAVADLGAVLKEPPLLNIVFSPRKLDRHAVLGETEHTVQHQKQNIAGFHAGNVPIIGTKFAESGQAVSGNGLHGYTDGHGGHLLMIYTLLYRVSLIFARFFAKIFILFCFDM